MEFPKLNNIKLLLIEDDQLTYLFLKQVFKIVNINITHASKGSEAIDFCLNNPGFDIVLTDMQLPDMVGTKIISEIRKHLPDIPIVTQTAARSPEIKGEAIAAGSNDFLLKPYKPEELYQVLSDLL